MPLLDLSSLLVVVDPKGEDAQTAFRFLQNAECRRFGRAKDALTDDDDDDDDDNDGIPSQVDLSAQMFDRDAVVPVHLALSFNPSPKDVSKGFVFGSDRETCDILLAGDKHSGVSGNLFSISVDWQTGNPLITCLNADEGSPGIRILSGNLWVLYLRNAWKVLDPGVATTIKISEKMELVVHSPSRENREPAYSSNLQMYFKKFQDAVPKMTHLNLYDPEGTQLLVSRGRGLTGMEYFTISTTVGETFVLCEAKSHQNRTGDSELFIIKRFRKVSNKWPDQAKTRLRKLRDLQHRNIIAPQDIITDNNEYMPVYLPEPPITLADRHNREPLNEDDTREVLGQVFEGLGFLHANDIFHGGLYPGNIRIEESGFWSIKLSDIGLNPYVDLENSNEQGLYASNQGRAPGGPGPVIDTWSAGVVGLRLLSPGGLPARSLRQRQSEWAQRVAKGAVDFHAAERPGPDGKKEAAHFLTRVLKYEFSERLTAAECLQDSWLQHWQLPVAYDLEDDPHDPPYYFPDSPRSVDSFNRAGFVDEEGSGEDTETEEPRTSASKGKQPQTSHRTSITPSSDPRRQRTATPQSVQYPGYPPTESRHTTLEPSESISNQGSRHSSAGPGSAISSNRAWDDFGPSSPYSRSVGHPIGTGPSDHSSRQRSTDRAGTSPYPEGISDTPRWSPLASPRVDTRAMEQSPPRRGGRSGSSGSSGSGGSTPHF